MQTTKQVDAAKLGQVQDIAEMTRQMFVSILKDSGYQRTAGSCLHASYLCWSLISKFADLTCRIVGGGGEGFGGIIVDGKAHGHYWVEVMIDEQCYIVDITADQFGLPEVIVAPAAEAPATYQPDDQLAVNAHVAELEAWLNPVGTVDSEGVSDD